MAYCKSCYNEGCEKCNFSGYYERISIAELIKIDEKISSIIVSQNNIETIKSYLNKKGFIDINKDGLLKVNENLTSIQEVLKAINNEWIWNYLSRKK